MSQLVNHSELQNVTVISPNQQLLLRLDNSLSGKDGFGRTNVQTFEQGLTVFSTVANTSASWSGAVSSVINFQPAITLVNSNSALWNFAFNRTTFLASMSGGWSAATTVTQGNSARWNATFTTVSTNSANWNSTFTSVNSNSANWQASYTAVENNAYYWGATTDRVDARAPFWDSGFNTTSSLSASWNSTQTTVNANSAIWNKVNDTLITGKILSGNDLRALVVTDSSPLINLDASKSSQTIICNASNGTVIAFAPNSVTDIPVNTQITFISFHSTGTTIFSAGPSVTLNSFNDSISAGGKNAAVTCLKSDIDTWFLIGNLA